MQEKYRPLVSIITVCYNSERTIRDTIESVRRQSNQDYEFIIIDGASTDNTINIINEYKSFFGEKMILVSEKDDGIYFAMNKGIEIAKGKLICLLNSDDWFEEDTINLISQEYQDEKYKVLYGMQRTITDNQEENCVIYNHNFLRNKMICHQATFVTKECFDKFGAFSTCYKSAADYDFMLRLFFSKEVDFSPIYKVLVNFRNGGMSNSYIAYKETADIKFGYGIISKKQKCYLYLKSWAVRLGIIK